MAGTGTGDDTTTSDRVIDQLVGCAYEGQGITSARDALRAVGLLDKDVLLDAALLLQTAPAAVRERVYDLLAGCIGLLDAGRRRADA